MVMMGSSESGLDPKTSANSSEKNEEDEGDGGSGSQNNTNSTNSTSPTTPNSNTNASLAASTSTSAAASASASRSHQDEIRSQLQIQIGPNGGTIISASRRKNQVPTSDEQMTKDLIAAQLERKEKLMRALLSEQSRVNKLKAEIGLLRSKLHSVPNLERLKDENQRLRIECDLMTREVDLYDNGTVPLGELNPEFYRDINPGQDANALISIAPPRKAPVSGRRPTGSRINAPAPPPRPPPPRYLPIPKVDSPTGEWCCTVCTFQNHPQLSQCEQCDMIRVTPSPSISPGGFPR